MPSPSLGWHEELNTKLNPICWAGPGTCGAVIYAWGGGIYDTLRDRLIIFGGGHGDYGGNEQYAFNMSGTPSAQRITDNTNPSACSQPSCDGGVTPNSRHTYDQLTYMANYDAMFVWSGALSGTGFAQQDAWMYFYGTQTWQYLNPISSGPMPVGSTNNAVVEYDPVSGKVYVWDGRSLYTYDYATKTWVGKFVTPNGYLAGYFVGTIDPIRRRMICWHSSGGMAYFDLDLAVGADPRHSLTPTGATSILSTANPGMAYDPVTTDIIMWIGGNNVYRYNPDTNVITAVTGYTGGPPTPAAPYGGSTGQSVFGTFGRWQYSPAQNVFVVVNDSDQNAFTFRLGASVPDTEAPTAPSNPAANAVSQSQINVTWDASTDNVGVTGYRIERCAGAACNTFVEVGTPTSTSFSNMGLSAGTVYRYRVRAQDAAGNLSSYSSIVQATTAAVDATPPTDPADLVATPESTTEISLTWTASTDAVGVTGYRVERAQGASGSFSQIGAPLSNVFTDSGLAQNTLYRYRVRATDAAGNFSGYSNIDDATTDAAAILNTGTGALYTTWGEAVAAAEAGAVIEGPAGIYANESFKILVSNVTLRCVGGGRAHLKWGTGDYRTNGGNLIPDPPTGNGQGIICVFASTGTTTIENFEFSGAAVTDNNGAGIRLGGGGNLTLRNVYAHDNQNGILGQSGPGNTLLIEFSRFENNGYFDGTFLAHNIYIGEMGRFILRHSASLDPDDGSHCVKSRAFYNEILYNHLSTKNSDGSLECEFPNGHFALVMGNVIEQGANSSNSTIISYAAEGLTSVGDVRHELYVMSNTIYSWRSPAGTFIQMVNSPTIYKAQNNARSTGGTFRLGTATSVTEDHNDALAIDQFVDANNHDFHLITGSTAINNGIASGSTVGPEIYSLVPTYEYVATASRTTRQVVGVLDVGAYEFGTAPQPKAVTFSRRT